MTKRGAFWTGELTFRYVDRTETVTASDDARYLIVLTPRLSALIAALQSDRDRGRRQEIE